MNKESQASSSVLMIKPVAFEVNVETASDNKFQHKVDMPADKMQEIALKEFNHYVSILESKGIEVIVVEDTPDPHTPDSIFPNNWLSTHSDGTVIIYPMEAEDRREERRRDIIEDLDRKYGFEVKRVIDFTREEQYGRFLEATGSMVFDYVNNIIYASISKRTSKTVLDKVAKELGCKIHCFEDVDREGTDIYHTNVVMCLGEKYCLLWDDGVTNKEKEKELVKSLEETGHEIVFLTFDQIKKFAGNALELRNQKGERFLVMSEKGVKSLTEKQKEILNKYVEIVPIPIDMIECPEGGSARCMICEIRLPKKPHMQDQTNNAV